MRVSRVVVFALLVAVLAWPSMGYGQQPKPWKMDRAGGSGAPLRLARLPKSSLARGPRSGWSVAAIGSGPARSASRIRVLLTVVSPTRTAFISRRITSA